MISVTRLDGSPLLLNMDLILSIERTPDTLVSLTTGDTVLVKETPEELVDRVTRYKRDLLKASVRTGASAERA
jgi:flagellar protein FlbD